MVINELTFVRDAKKPTSKSRRWIESDLTNLSRRRETTRIRKKSSDRSKRAETRLLPTAVIAVKYEKHQSGNPYGSWIPGRIDRVATSSTRLVMNSSHCHAPSHAREFRCGKAPRFNNKPRGRQTRGRPADDRVKSDASWGRFTVPRIHRFLSVTGPI